MMDKQAGQTTSVWMTTEDVQEARTLTESPATDVCIIGAGIAGLSTAYCLAREGRSVIVLDDGRVGRRDDAKDHGASVQRHRRRV